MSDCGKEKRALVLAGSGIAEFLCGVGILTAYDEWNGSHCSANDFDIYVGTSAGSVLCALLADGAAPWKIFKAIHSEREGDSFYFAPPDINGVRTSGALNLFGQFARTMVDTLGRAFAQRWRSAAVLPADLQEDHPGAFYSTEALETTLCTKLSALRDRHHFKDLTRQLYVSGTDIDTGEHLVFGDGELADVHICRAVAASCALPTCFRPTRIGDKDVVGGVISKAHFLSIALAKGARDILFVNPVVSTRKDCSSVCPPSEGSLPRLADNGVGWTGEQALRLMHSHYPESALEHVCSTSGAIRLAYVEPSRDDIPMFMQNMMSLSARAKLLAFGLKTGRTFFATSGAPGRNPS